MALELMVKVDRTQELSASAVLMKTVEIADALSKVPFPPEIPVAWAVTL